MALPAPFLSKEFLGDLPFSADDNAESSDETCLLLLCERRFLVGERSPFLSLLEKLNVRLRARERFVDLSSVSFFDSSKFSARPALTDD